MKILSLIGEGLAEASAADDADAEGSADADAEGSADADASGEAEAAADGDAAVDAEAAGDAAGGVAVPPHAARIGTMSAKSIVHAIIFARCGKRDILLLLHE
jgi:hypothetical protein